VVIRVSDYYPHGATIGTAQATVIGADIALVQTNSLAPTLPTIACREQLVNVGALPAGSYTVTWTTTENIAIPFPTTNTRVRTFAFTVLAASAVPTLNVHMLILLALAVAAVGIMHSAR
jgi:hypothetical protein